MASQNTTTSTLISQVYISRITLLELMTKQGYDVSEYEGFSINEVNTMKTNIQLDMIFKKKDETDQRGHKKLYVRYYLTKSLKPNIIQDMIDELFTMEEILTKQDTLLIINKEYINDSMINELKHIWEQDKIYIVVQSLQRLQFNVLGHRIVPPHRVLTINETEKIKNKYNIIDDSLFPEISRFDPVAQAIFLKPGEVCEILRPSKTSITAPYYRICVNI